MSTNKAERPEISKGKSPFYPGQPVPLELFVGRSEQIDRIMTRGVGQVSQGKPVAIYVQGEYGIGKSSIAGFVSSLAEKDQGLHGIYAPLGGAKSVTDVAAAVLEATVRSGAFDLTRSEKVKEWLGTYIGKQALFGITVDLAALKRDAPNLSTPFSMLAFLGEALERLKDLGVRGIFLVLDEINGITADPQFAHFIKGLVDTNAMSKSPLPLLLMLCGVEARRREMIEKHQPIDRIFDVIDIEPMNAAEMIEFFTRAFDSVGMEVEPAAMNVLTQYSAGFPKIMHIVGDSAYWINTDNVVSEVDAYQAVVMAAQEVGAKYVDQQVYRALRSADYHSILEKIAKMGPNVMTFARHQVASDLTDGQKKKLDNFLRKMKQLNVIRGGEVRGEYIFNTRMVRVYIWLQSLEKARTKQLK
jgi:hypothetical protein